MATTRWLGKAAATYHVVTVVVGGTVEVVYSKWFPTVHNIKANLKTSSPNFYIMSISAGLMILCLILMFWTIHKIYAHKEEDRHY